MKIYISDEFDTENYHIRLHNCTCDSNANLDYYKITRQLIDDNMVHSHEFGAVFEGILKRPNACECGNRYTTIKVSSKEVTVEELELIKKYAGLVQNLRQ